MVKEIRYITQIGKGVVYNDQNFKDEVAAYLADPDGWVSQGYRFIYTSKNPNIFIELCHPNTIATNGCEDSELSCAEMGGHRMYLNSERWIRNGSKSKLNLKNYRQYMVTHEMGHILGYDHVKCPGKDSPAPVMMQQTLGIGECKPNTKLTQTDLKSKQ
jgi:hypothetical protein